MQWIGAQLGFQDLRALIPFVLIFAAVLIWSIRQESRAKYSERAVDRLERTQTKLLEKISRLEGRLDKRKDD